MRFFTVVKLFILLIASCGCSAAPTSYDEPSSRPTVVLLHGLARSASSMHEMGLALRVAGYRICNIAYPSREYAINALASKFVAPSIVQCAPDTNKPIHFVTHSMGGIIVRELARAELVENFGRVVMLGPPNHGSEVVDALGDWRLFDTINGPAGSELGTSLSSTPQRLGLASFPVGIIAGNLSINWINSFIIPGADDGKVSVESAKLEGMKDFIVINGAHPFLMKNEEAIKQTIQFLDSGCFLHDNQQDALTGAEKCVPLQ